MGKINYKKGFTLIELLVVISIIGLLSSVILGSLGSARQKSKDTFVASSILSYITALKAYYADKGYYPINGALYTGYCLGGTVDGCRGQNGIQSSYLKTELSTYISSWGDPSPYERPVDDGWLPTPDGASGASIMCTQFISGTCSKSMLYWFKNVSAKCNIGGSIDYGDTCGVLI